ncbi:roadblock/LC7 domain-containing protein [Paraliomyxa miuraensis]|uniref:hypothetical protein n=1 Tax=Paraliomyxa miuraensis TaxID=376150 RepID=UPI002250C18A|nr:hypothetical protein [Paraliomyxa miuraensis]MCX4247208.1 hypothetical protein [Paraliomyxa miuraensis]
MQLLRLLEELGVVQGVRGAIIATADGALSGKGKNSLPEVTANDVAKTVRRMTVASATVGVPLQELLINFGAARMMVVPLRDDATVVVLLERDSAVSAVRNLLNAHLGEIRELLDAQGNDDDDDVAPEGDEVEDEIGRIMKGELGPVLDRIAHQYAIYVGRAGKSREEAGELMREQLREWLLCCNPSPYTLPLLVDGLGLTLNDSPTARGEFMEVVQNTIRNVPAGR